MNRVTASTAQLTCAALWNIDTFPHNLAWHSRQDISGSLFVMKEYFSELQRQQRCKLTSATLANSMGTGTGPFFSLSCVGEEDSWS